MTKTMDELFTEEEDRKRAEHQAWLNDPVAQAAEQAKFEKRQAELAAMPDDPEDDDLDGDEDFEEDEEDDGFDDDGFDDPDPSDEEE